MPYRFLPMILLFMTFASSGCHAEGFRYPAVPQPPGAIISADYSTQRDMIVVSIDTDGRRLEEAWIKKPDGAEVKPLSIAQQNPNPNPPPSAGMGSMSGASGVAGYTPPPPPPPQTTRPLTIATFSSEALGPPPWNLHIKLQGVPEAVVPNLGGPIKEK